MELPVRNQLLFLVVFAFPFAGIAQLEGMDGAANFSGAERHMFRSFDNRYEGVRGYPTLLEDFVEGTAELKNGAIAWRVDLNLDIVTGELLLRSRETKKILVVQTKHVKSFVLRDAAAGNLEFFNIDGVGFCRRLHESQVKLYLKHTKYVEKANFGGPYNNNGKRYDEFTAENKYYLFKGDSLSEEIRVTRKTVEKVFPDKSAEIRYYFRERKPDLKKPDEIASLFDFLAEGKSENP